MAAQRFMPSSSCRMQDADGSGWSGEAVATTSRSTSEGPRPATASARSAANLPSDPTLLDPGALGDPLVIGVDQWLQVRVGEDVRGHGGPQSYDLGGHYSSFLIRTIVWVAVDGSGPFRSRFVATLTSPRSRKLPMALERSQAEQDLAGCHQLALPRQVRHDLAAEGAQDRDAGCSVADLAQQVAPLDVWPLVGESREGSGVEAPVTRRDREALGEHHHLPLIATVTRRPVAALPQSLDDLRHTLGVPHGEHLNPLHRALDQPGEHRSRADLDERVDAKIGQPPYRFRPAHRPG